METKSKLMVIQGPNINMLGTREPDIYGSMKMEDIHAQMKLFAEQNGIEIEFFQSNFEGELVDKIQECFGEFDGQPPTRTPLSQSATLSQPSASRSSRYISATSTAAKNSAKKAS